MILQKAKFNIEYLYHLWTPFLTKCSECDVWRVYIPNLILMAAATSVLVLILSSPLPQVSTKAATLALFLNNNKFGSAVLHLFRLPSVTFWAVTIYCPLSYFRPQFASFSSFLSPSSVSEIHCSCTHINYPSIWVSIVHFDLNIS